MSKAADAVRLLLQFIGVLPYPEKLQEFQILDVTPQEFYLMDTRRVWGNAAIWWAPGSSSSSAG